jgi:hypothetical protein
MRANYLLTLIDHNLLQVTTLLQGAVVVVPSAMGLHLRGECITTSIRAWPTIGFWRTFPTRTRMAAMTTLLFRPPPPRRLRPIWS